MSSANVCMLSYSEFPGDVRVSRQVLALRDSGYSVDVICVTEGENPKTDSWSGCAIYRVKLSERRGGYLRYICNYMYFTSYCLLKLLKLNMHKKYKIVHVHNPPDTLVFSAILLRVLFKTKIILNIHDPLPELLASRSGKSMSDPIVRLANAVEIIFARLSDSVITVNDVIKTDLKAKGIESSVVMNVLPLQRMEYPPKKSKSFVVVSVGHLLPHRDMETVIEGVKLARDNVPDVVLHVVGGGEMLDTLKRKVVAEGLHEIVFFYGETPHDTAMTEIANSDACVIPFGDTPINQIGTPYKLFEYIFCGKPVLAPRLRALKSLLKEDECYFFKPGNSKELAENIVRIHDNPSGAKETVRRAGRIVKEYNWDIMEKRLIECYKKLE